MSSRRLGGFLIGTLVCLLHGCFGSGSVAPPTYSAASVANEAMKLFDTNKDGKLDEKELMSVPSLKNSLADLDKDGDKAISKEELETRLQEMLDSKVGIFSISCRVTRGGQPVPDVEVQFIPEAFFGKALKPASGKSRADGYVEVRCEGNSDPGLAPGFYRVEASLKGAGGTETLPASLNSQTKLGYQIRTMARGAGTIEIIIP